MDNSEREQLNMSKKHLKNKSTKSEKGISGKETEKWQVWTGEAWQNKTNLKRGKLENDIKKQELEKVNYEKEQLNNDSSEKDKSEVGHSIRVQFSIERKTCDSWGAPVQMF